MPKVKNQTGQPITVAKMCGGVLQLGAFEEKSVDSVPPTMATHIAAGRVSVTSEPVSAVVEAEQKTTSVRGVKPKGEKP